MALLKLNWFNGATTVKIWSDVGPKHFKISANMKFFGCSTKFPTYQMNLQKFASYHGCSVCDGVAAQAKGILNRTMRDTQMTIRKVPEAIQTVGKLGGHVTSTIEISSNNFSTQTLQGIKSFHNLKLTQNNYICAYNTSQDSTHKEIPS